jgi:soluble lytic murein transglycosylase
MLLGRYFSLALALLIGLVACSAPPPRPGAAASIVRAQAGTGVADVRVEFRAALARAGQPGSADSPALQAYVLYPYVIAARLQAALSGQPAPSLAAPANALDAQVAAFLQAHRGEPVTRGLAHDWLVRLASQQRWPLFLEHVGDLASAQDDPVLACDTLSAQLATGAVGARADLTATALVLWSQPIEHPAACDRLFDWLQQQGLLTASRLEARARAALAAGHAALGFKLAAQLPDAQAAPLREWAHLLLRPDATLKALARTPSMPVEPDALAAGVQRLALSDSASAADVLPRLLKRPDMSSQLAGQLQRSVALGLAYDHAPGASAALQALPAAARDDTVREWGARIALWNRAWPQALAWLNELSPQSAAEPRWRYWRARALEAVDGYAAAEPTFRLLAGLRDYYGYLAADFVHLPYDLQAHPTPADPLVQSALARQPGLLRAHELFACGLTDAARLEWAVALLGATKEQRIQAAQLADEWGWYAQAIAQLGLANDLDDVALRYPRPYADAVSRASSLTDVPPDWVLAVMRQESLFRADAVSRANAQGLMQLLPTTAAAVALRWHLPLNGADALFDPGTAVTLGAAHLRELLNQYDGAIALALAAYNAGAAPVARWRPPQAMDADIWIENIAYGETRDYVERVLEHIVAFRWVSGAPLPRLSGLLPAVGPASADLSRR